MKTDDDMYVNLPLLKSHLQRAHPHPHRVITGCVKNGPQGAPQPIGHNVRIQKVFGKLKHSIGSKFGTNLCYIRAQHLLRSIHPSLLVLAMCSPETSLVSSSRKASTWGSSSEGTRVFKSFSVTFNLLTFSIINRVEDAFLTGYCARALGGVEKVDIWF